MGHHLSRDIMASIYRSIACLPMKGKLLTEIMRKKLNGHLKRSELLMNDQEGCVQGSRVTKDQLFCFVFHNTILSKCQRRLTSISY